MRALLMVGLLSLLGLLIMSGVEGQETPYVFTSGYSSQMGVYRLAEGNLVEEERWEVEPNLTWLEQDQETGDIWAIHEVGEYQGVQGGAVSRWSFENGALAMKQSVSIGSPGPAHLLLDMDHRLAYTANYGGGTFTIFSITQDNQIGQLLQTEQYGEGCRDSSHPHQVVRRGDIVWVVDLGCDSVYQYRASSTGVERIGETSVKPGSGPRHMALHPTRDLAFLACELQSCVQVYSVDFTSGDLTFLQELIYSSSDSNHGAEILVSDDGNTVYASTRGMGAVVVYRLQEDDILERVQEQFTLGTWPRSITIQDNLMIVADKVGEAIEILTINESTGELTSTGQLTSTIGQPAFIGVFSKSDKKQTE